ncbi:MAG: hypothetical protein MZV70_34500 [Desulfobacterales bacterium]|nr:hypothetical protein [Desulfobacterales bacterium]
MIRRLRPAGPSGDSDAAPRGAALAPEALAAEAMRWSGSVDAVKEPREGRPEGPGSGRQGRSRLRGRVALSRGGGASPVHLIERFRVWRRHDRAIVKRGLYESVPGIVGLILVLLLFLGRAGRRQPSLDSEKGPEGSYPDRGGPPRLRSGFATRTAPRATW